MSDDLDLPYYSSDELWRELTTSRIGFFTSKTSAKIPNKPGVYAWILPLELNGDASSVIRKNKTILSYDSMAKDIFCFEQETEYQWQKIDVTLKTKTDYRRETTQEKYWSELESVLEKDDLKSMRQIFLLSSLFTKPLYVGLTKNLYNRYQQHTTESDKNSFNKRFESFSKEKGLNKSVKDLIFVGITLPLNLDEATIDKQLKVLEYMLKNISGPVFGEK